MTQPVEQAPGAPIDTAPTDNNPAPDAPEADPKPADDISALPEWAQKKIRDLRSEATKARTSAKQTAAEEARNELTAQIAKALGITKDEPVSAEELAGQIEQYQASAFRSAVELGVYRVAGEFGVDAELLLDSNRFIDSLDDIVELDPQSPEFKDQLKAKVQEAAATGRYKTAGQASAAPTTPRPDPSQGARGPAVSRPTSLGDAIAQHYAQR